MFGILEAVAVPHTGIYNTYEDLMKELNNRVTKEGYKIVKARSHRGRTGGSDIPGNEMVRCDLVCDRGGRPYKCMATKHKTSTKKTGCPWKAKAVHRKTIGGWVLTITCDQHNHEPGTPEPPTPEISEAEDNEAADAEDLECPQPDEETSAALQVAGVSNAVLRLTGDTFHQFKGDYRKMSQPERLGILSQLQLRIAAIYAVQNEDVQRNQRHEAQKKRHEEIERAKKQRHADRGRARRQNQQQEPLPSVEQQPLPQQPMAQMGQSPAHPQILQQPQHSMPQQHMPQNHQMPHMGQQFGLTPDSPSQQLLSMNMAHIQQYTGPPAKRPRASNGSRPMPGQQTPQQVPQ